MTSDEIYVCGFGEAASSTGLDHTIVNVYQWKRSRGGRRLALTRSLSPAGQFSVSWPVGIAFDSGGQLYVADEGSCEVLVFGAGAKDNDPPQRTIQLEDSAGLLGSITSIAIDRSDNLYVMLSIGGVPTKDPGGTICVLPPGSSGFILALPRTLTGILGNTDLKMAFDSADNLYVSGGGSSAEECFVAVYAAQVATRASGPVAASHVIAGSNTRLTGPSRMAFDSYDCLYVADQTNVLVFSPEDIFSNNGNIAPVAEISGPASGVVNGLEVAVDSADRVYVGNTISNENTPSNVIVYRPEDIVFNGGVTDPAAAQVVNIDPFGGIAVRKAASSVDPVVALVERSAISRAVSFLQMVDGDPHIPMGPERIAQLAAGIALAANARSFDAAIRSEALSLAAKQIGLAAESIQTSILEEARQTKSLAEKATQLPVRE